MHISVKSIHAKTLKMSTNQEYVLVGNCICIRKIFEKTFSNDISKKLLSGEDDNISYLFGF